MRVMTVWTQGLSEEAKKPFAEGLVSNPYLRLLRKILEVRKEGRRRKMNALDNFEKPQWAIRRAAADAADGELDHIIDLISFEDQHGG